MSWWWTRRCSLRLNWGTLWRSHIPMMSTGERATGHFILIFLIRCVRASEVVGYEILRRLHVPVVEFYSRLVYLVTWCWRSTLIKNSVSQWGLFESQRLLKGKRIHIISSVDAPVWTDEWIILICVLRFLSSPLLLQVKSLKDDLQKGTNSWPSLSLRRTTLYTIRHALTHRRWLNSIGKV